ncbi:MAG TPA: tetratricopeptide repeat protein [Thiolinea sp.]|nr:tetratricopeptide repeat protein [Thiolinea sp.]
MKTINNNNKKRWILPALLPTLLLGMTAVMPAVAQNPAFRNTHNTPQPAGQLQSSTSTGQDVASWYQGRKQARQRSPSSVSVLQTEAQNGNPDSQYQLALLYHSGQGVAKDLNQALTWYARAAEAGNNNAQYALALLYRSGEVPMDTQVSLQWQQSAASKGNIEAMYGLGVLYANGQYVARDVKQARFWLVEAARRGHQGAGLVLAGMEPEAAGVAGARGVPGQEMGSAAAVLTRTAEAETASTVEHHESSVNLDGRSPEEIRRLAFRGDAAAQMMLGAMYEDGAYGVAQDPGKALEWYLKAARQGFVKAQHNLALLYEDGRGVEQDFRQAAIWYKKAADAGFSEAQNNLAVLYILGRGVEQNAGKAELLLQQAVAQGNENAVRNLTLLHGQG